MKTCFQVESAADVPYNICSTTGLFIYTRARKLQPLRLQFIGDYKLKPRRQIFPIDSSVNFPCDNNFLY